MQDDISLHQDNENVDIYYLSDFQDKDLQWNMTVILMDPVLAA